MSDDVSELFTRAFLGGGGIVVECHCGRTHFAGDEHEGDFDPGEFDRLLDLARKHPDRWIQAEYGCSVGYVEIDRKTLVIGCPCSGLARYEEFIWAWRRQIADYLTSRIEAEFACLKLEIAAVGEPLKKAKHLRDKAARLAYG